MQERFLRAARGDHVVALALLAMLIELCLGYPQRLVRAIGHPVTWIGGLIGALDRLLNRDATRTEPASSRGLLSRFWSFLASSDRSHS